MMLALKWVLPSSTRVVTSLLQARQTITAISYDRGGSTLLGLRL